MILFRADGNKEIGAGHIMRCLSIADAFKRIGEECVFALADDSMQGIITARKYKAYVLKSDYRHMDSEIEEMMSVIGRFAPDMLIVDSYFVSKMYFESLRKNLRLIYMDDLAAFAYPVDVLINYNVYSLDIDYRKIYFRESISYPTVLFGVEFTPLRKGFMNIAPKNQNKICKDILISTGGSDLTHLALKLVRYIKKKNDGRHYHLLLGSMNSDDLEIYQLASGISNIHIHSNVNDMKSLIYSCDIAVSAAGSTMYEICACGVPIITYAIADNQILGDKKFKELGLSLSCGDLRTECEPEVKIYNCIEKISSDYMWRVNVGKKMQEYVDGYGADRIVHGLGFCS